jgi:Uma2 family endonuclease
MSTIQPSARIDTLADLLGVLGGIAPDRVRFRPAPGTATKEDVLEVERTENRLCELVNGVLVEKPMGYRESVLALALGSILRAFVERANLGIVSGPDGMTELFPGLVRIPDVAFAAWSRVPGGAVPTDPIPELTPDLAVEILSRSNTAAEMERKRSEYFAAGVRLVWMIDPERRTVEVSSSPSASAILSGSETLDGSDVLPGFKLPLPELFAPLDRKAG